MIEQIPYEIMQPQQVMHEQTPVVAQAELSESMNAYRLNPNEPQLLPLDGSLEELASEMHDGQRYVQIAAVNLGQDAPLNVWAVKQPDGVLRLDSITLTPDNGQTLSDLIGLGKKMTVTERTGTESVGRSNSILAVKLGFDTGVSRQHLEVKLDEAGFHLKDLASTNGTVLIAKLKQVNELTTPVVPQVEQTVEREVSHSFDVNTSVYDDPKFVELYDPLRRTQHHYETYFKENEPKLLAAVEAARHAETPEASYAAENDLRTFRTSYEDAQKVLRAEMEAAIKPYLAERLRVLADHRTAGYAENGQLSISNGRLISERGKVIGHQVAGLREYVAASSNPRLGQISVPERFNSWAGSNNGKTNHVTGKTTTSHQHIIDLAAAMVSGNWQAEAEPMLIERDWAKEFDLPSDVRGKLPLYKVVLGMHRMAAERLLHNLDDGVGNIPIKQTENPYN